MHLLDRQLIRSYLKAYLVCLISLLSLYVVVDLFTNLDDFADTQKGLSRVLRHISTYYGYRIIYIFDRLCEAIILLAAMFTVAWMQRSNELLPQLSAGVSTQRVVRPVLLSACAMIGLTVANQELVVPRFARELLQEKDDPQGDRDILVYSAYEPNGILIKGRSASRKQRVVREFSCMIPEQLTRNLIHLTAAEAYYYPPGDGPSGGGGWLLTGTMPREPDGWDGGDLLRCLDPGKFFLKTTTVDFDMVTRSRTWYSYASTISLMRELDRGDSSRLASMAVVFHMRLTRPILGMLLVFMGLSVILRDQNRNVFISTALCLTMCAIFFGVGFACKHLGDNEYLSPALAAWLPVLLFGPLAFVLFDAIHT